MLRQDYLKKVLLKVKIFTKKLKEIKVHPKSISLRHWRDTTSNNIEVY